ncbi:MAG TPA: Trp biosynthesis-associated membrane protein [Micromonosporaceae bacterium]
MSSPDRPTDRRGLVTAVVMCVAGAGIALLAAERTWSTTLTRRAAPLPPVHTAHTGSSQLGWLVAVALVGLAGAGALLATRGGVRVVIGALLGLVGLIVLGGGIDGLRLADGARLVWPALVVVGGVLVGLAGFRAMRDGPSWPAMGAKYEAPSMNRPVTEASMWDDLDRGVDPTTRD